MFIGAGLGEGVMRDEERPETEGISVVEVGGGT